MNPSSLSWLLSVNSTANQMKVASTSPSFAMSAERQHAGGEQHAEAEERDRGRVDAEASPPRPRAPPSRGTCTVTIFSSRRQRPKAASACACGGRRLRRRGDLRRHDPVEHRRQQRHRQQRRHRRGQQPASRTRCRRRTRARSRSRAGWRPWPSATAPTTALRLAMPENIRKRAEPRARRRPGRAPAASGQREGQRVQHAGARGVAREGRRDDASTRNRLYDEAQRRAAEQAHHQVADPLAEAALDHRARDQERDDDQQDRAVGEPGRTPFAGGRMP